METNQERQIQFIEISKVKEYKNNARYHTDDQIAQVEASIQEFGFTNPVLIDEDNIILAGHCRRLAAIGIGMEKIPCIVLEGLTPEQKKALRIADNRLPQNAQWNVDLLINEVSDLYNSGYNVDMLGFDDEAINKMLNSIKIPDTETEAPPAGPEGEPAGESINPESEGETPAPEDLDNQDNDLAGLEEVTISIRIPAKFGDQVKQYLAGDELQTPGGMGRGILKKLELI